MPQIHQIIETSLYVRDLAETERFYRRVFEIEPYGKAAGRHLFFKVGGYMLLLFVADSTRAGDDLPAHGASGPGHVAFAVSHEDVEAWRRHLQACGVPIEHEHTWPSGGRSIYFRDPSGNSLELVTPDTWPDA